MTGAVAGGGPVEVVTLGETMALLSAPGIGLLRHATSLNISCGGAESNLAIGVARLGHHVAWVGRTGADEFGALVRRSIAAEGVDCRVIVDPAGPTGLMVKARRTPTVTQVNYYRSGSAGSRLAPDDVDPAVLAAARVVHLTGITPALSASARAATRFAVTTARDAGVMVSVAVNYRRALWSPEAAAVELTDLVGLADIVFASEAEAAMLVPGGSAEDLAAGLAALGPRQVLVTRGADGACAVIDGLLLTADAVPVVAIDPVGAGDAFAAGYLSGLLDGEPPAARLERAILAGAFAVTVPGDWEGLPSRTDLALLASTESVLR
jgi:2-dehydro-3-deoxygluconokinase